MVFPEWVKELVDPCFDCQPRERVQRQAKRGTTASFDLMGQATVELVISPLAGLRGFAGYHTSVLVAGEEYYFSPSGICCSPKLTSHEACVQLQHVHIGLSRMSGVDLLDFLTDYFRPGTYDLLRKNCNSFTDCALFFLCCQRLEPRFRQIERIGRAADEHARLVQVVSRGEYVPNSRAFGFNLEQVIGEIEAERLGRGDEESDGEFETGRHDGANQLGKEGGGYVSDGGSSSGDRGNGEVHPWLADAVTARSNRDSCTGEGISETEPTPCPEPTQPKLRGAAGGPRRRKASPL